MAQYKITRRFTAGTLAGLTHSEVSTVAMPVGFSCQQPLGGSPYVIISCDELHSPYRCPFCGETYEFGDPGHIHY